MAKFYWSTTVFSSNAATITFNPSTDIFIFDAASLPIAAPTEIAASQVTFAQTGTGNTSSVTMTYAGKTLTLSNTGNVNGVKLEQLTNSTSTTQGNIRFNDESKLIVGDNAINPVNSVDGTLMGTAGTNQYDDAANTLSGTFGSDVLLGLGGNDTLNGNAGNDFLDGGLGNDIMAGGTGADTYIVNSTGDSATDAGTDLSEIDVVRISLVGTLATPVTYSMGAGIEQLEQLADNATNYINIIGNTLANTITGTSAPNWLDGGAGTDKLVGGAGSDTYVVDSAGDSISDPATAAGSDWVLSSVAFALPGNIENLALSGTSNVNATGNTFGNIIVGNNGTNSMVGGDGNDTYVVHNTTDTVTEVSTATSASAGTSDMVVSLVSYTLGNNVENLMLDGALFQATYNTLRKVPSTVSITTGSAISGTGNGTNNLIIGNSLANVLDGGGTNNTDILVGGLGNDTFKVDSTSDVVNDGGSWTIGSGVQATVTQGGTDTVISTAASYTITAGNIENLTLAGTSAAIAGGNASDNTLTSNVLASGGNTLVGGAGNDTFVVVNSADVASDTMATGITTGGGTDTVMSSVSYTLPSSAVSGTVTTAEIENLTLTGTAVSGTGNSLNNMIIGNGTSNSLNGAGGPDTLIGGLGNDTFTVSSVSDVVGDSSVTISGASVTTTVVGGGVDTVLSTVSFTLPSTPFATGGTTTLGAEIENLNLSPQTTTGLVGTGNSLANTITSGTVAAGNTLAGGLGNDTYVVVNTTDIVNESASAGTDTVQSSVTYALSTTSEVEHLVLTGSSIINGTGNGLNNSITGNSVANILDGGAGNDTLIGSGGNDTYVVGEAGDSIIETAGGGTDTVNIGISYTLGNGDVEILSLTGVAGVTAVGNGLSNTLIGNNSSATCTLIGLGGNDTYVVTNAATTVTDSSATTTGSGTDVVEASVNYILTDTSIENLTLTGSALSGTGNALANIITGNTGNNKLDGGVGADRLIGLGGNDTYVVDNVGDVIVETSTGGTADEVWSGISYTLASDSNVERMVLTGSAISGTGNSLANAITGNAGANVLVGGAGNDTLNGGTGGNDTLTGGSGNDVYVMSTGTDVDTIVFEATGLTNGLDTIGTTTPATSFSRGATGDKLDFNLFINTTNITLSTTVFNDTDTSEIAVTNGNVLQMNDTGTALTTDAIANLFVNDAVTDTVFAAPQSGSKFVLISAAATGNATVWYLNMSADGFSGDLSSSDVSKVATLVGINSLGTTAFDANNFIA